MNLHLVTMAADAGAFWGSDLGGVIKSLLVAVGILIVLVALLKGASDLISGKPGPAVKKLVGGFVVAAFCFRPELFSTIIDIFANLLDSGANTVDDMSNTKGGL